MATNTAKILVGTAHPYDGGIIPDYYLFLSENDVARLKLFEEILYISNEAIKDQRMFQWIPTVDMLEGGPFHGLSLYLKIC